MLTKSSLFHPKRNFNLPRAFSMPKRTFRDNNRLINSMINSRIEKLRFERDYLINNRNNHYVNLSNIFYNPYLYNYPYFEPVFYPTPIQPVTIPKIDYHFSVPQYCHCSEKTQQSDNIILYISEPQQSKPAPPPEPVILPKIETKYIYKTPDPPPKKPNYITNSQHQYISPHREKRNTKLKPTLIEQNTQTTEPNVQNEVNSPKPKIPKKRKIIEEIPKLKEKKPRLDWWRLCRDFVNCYLYFSTGKKYGNKYAKIRNNNLKKRTIDIIQDISVIKDWIVSIEEPFWNEFQVFEDLNVSYKKSDSKKKIKKETQKIVAIIKKFIENLISKATKLKDIPDRVEEVLYEFIKDGAYFPKKYLTTFQINRLDFEFYGSTKYVSVKQAGMLVAMLIISGVVVQQLLLHMRDVFPEFSKFKNIDVSAKYIGSVLHYMTRDAFIWEPPMVKDILALFDYYRSYHLYHDRIERQADIFNVDMNFLEGETADEYAEFLVPESEINDFWELNEGFVNTYKDFVFSWACKLAKSVKTKFSKVDPDLEPKRRKSKPMDRTVKEIVEDEESKE